MATLSKALDTSDTAHLHYLSEVMEVSKALGVFELRKSKDTYTILVPLSEGVKGVHKKLAARLYHYAPSKAWEEGASCYICKR